MNEREYEYEPIYWIINAGCLRNKEAEKIQIYISVISHIYFIFVCNEIQILYYKFQYREARQLYP